MHVRARCFATLRELSAARSDLDLAADASVSDAWDALVNRHPGLAAHRPYTQPARNGIAVRWDEPLAEGDEVAFLPPVSGGSDEPPVGLTNGPIDVTALERIAGLTHGAVVTFVGRARNRADDGREVLELEYEAYPEMAEATLRAVAAEVVKRWPGCAVAVVHRTGAVPIGDAAVAIVTAAPHRADAYEANRYVIEAIKQRLPIWKLERFADGTQWKRPGA
ncbi:MAG TPA: molybdenum cofactor biosynthesis protein MoaE [Candidatus Limnocylindria bacterium]|jgi:molybdopterin synthase catalytic subunit